MEISRYDWPPKKRTIASCGMTRKSDHSPPVAKQFFSKTPNSEQDSVEEGLWSGRTSRNVNVDGYDVVDSSEGGIILAKDAAAYATGANGHHDSRFRHSLVGLQQGKLHVPGDGTGDQEHVGVTRRCHELNSEAFDVMDRIVERDDFHFASVASPCVHFPDGERASREIVDRFPP